MQITQEIRERIAKQPSYVQSLIADPHSALGVDAETTVRVLQDSDDVLHLVIPTEPVVFDDGADIGQQAIAKAQTDRGFCRRLLAQPRSVLSSELGVALPEDVKIVVVQDTHRVVHVVCPPHEAAGITPVRNAAAVGSSASWGCEVTTDDSPCTVEGNSFCTSTQGCKTVGGGDPDCTVNPDPGGPIGPGTPEGPSGPLGPSPLP